MVQPSQPSENEKRAGALLVKKIETGAIPEIEQIISAAEYPKDMPIKNGMTALMVAASEGSKDALTVIIQHTPNINIQDQTGRTALHYACQGAKQENVELLL